MTNVRHRIAAVAGLAASYVIAACASNSHSPTPLPVASFWTSRPAGHVYTLMPSPATVVYGGYDPAAAPALRVASGDEVIVGAVSTCGTRLLQAGGDSGAIEPAFRAIAAAVRDSTLRRGPGGHVLTGPIHVAGAEPGDVLEVRIESVDIDLPFACNAFGPRSGFLPEDFPGESRSRVIPLDLARRVARFSDSLGIEVPLAPFFGSIGVAPSWAQGRVNSAPPGRHAGNLDNRMLVAGTILYIPVHMPGALLLVGDGHAAQGDGEVDITALETALRGRFQLIVRKDLHFDWPRGETRDAWIAMGADSNLTVAAKIATRQAIALLGDTYHLSRQEAYQLLSVAADVRITQLVDGTMGVHVVIPKSLFTRPPVASGTVR